MAPLTVDYLRKFKRLLTLELQKAGNFSANSELKITSAFLKSPGCTECWEHRAWNLIFREEIEQLIKKFF